MKLETDILMRPPWLIFVQPFENVMMVSTLISFFKIPPILSNVMNPHFNVRLLFCQNLCSHFLKTRGVCILWVHCWPNFLPSFKKETYAHWISCHLRRKTFQWRINTFCTLSYIPRVVKWWKTMALKSTIVVEQRTNFRTYAI